MKYFLFREVLLKSQDQSKTKKNQIRTTRKTRANICTTGQNQKYILCVSLVFITAIIKSLCWKKKLSIDLRRVHSLVGLK